MKLLLIFTVIISSAYAGMGGNESEPDLQPFLILNARTRSEIEGILNDTKARIEQYPKIYRDVYDKMLQYAKENWALDLLRSEDTDVIISKAYNLLKTNVPKMHKDIQESCFQIMVGFAYLYIIFKIVINASACDM